MISTAILSGVITAPDEVTHIINKAYVESVASILEEQGITYVVDDIALTITYTEPPLDWEPPVI